MTQWLNSVSSDTKDLRFESHPSIKQSIQCLGIRCMEGQVIGYERTQNFNYRKIHITMEDTYLGRAPILSVVTSIGFSNFNEQFQSGICLEKAIIIIIFLENTFEQRKLNLCNKNFVMASY